MILLLTVVNLLILFFLEGSVTAHIICMNKEFSEKQFTLNCTVDVLTADIDIIFPNNISGYAYCIVPVSLETNCTCRCKSTVSCKCLISQDIPTKTTTLQIISNDLSSLFGCYSCTHGSDRKSLMVAKSTTEKCADDVGNDETSCTVCWTLLSISVVICILTCIFPFIQGRIFNCIKSCFSGKRKQAGYDQLKDTMECATCNEILTCALCVECKEYYCDVCCVHHRDMNYDHIMFPTQQIVVNKKKVYCNSITCSKIAEQFCINCWKPFCTLCSKRFHCKDKKIINIYQVHDVRKQQKSGDAQNKLIPLYNVSFQNDSNPIRVCGMALLVDATVVVIDGNNNKLIVFKSKEEQSMANNELSNEPNAITAITGNQFAVTYPYQRYIQLYELTYDTLQSNYRVSSLDKINTGGKPFSIAYNQGIFAVEIGEREDGRIVIIDVKEKTPIKTIECHFAYFTGHTIRLALDQNRIFVSAMGKKMVSCMDFEGKTLWHKSVPGPRAIIVSEDYSSCEKIILASKRCNAIYELKKEGDHHEILKATDKINSPRYMAYHSVTNTLCVLVGNDRTHEDELRFLKFENAELEESTSPSEEIQLQSLSHC